MSNEDTVHEVRDFVDVLTDLEDGRTAQVLTEHLMELVQAVKEVGKPGALKLTLSVGLDRAEAIVTPKIDVTIPKHPRRATLFFVGNDGQLLRDDPRQLTLKNINDRPTPLRTVPAEPDPIDINKEEDQ